MEIPSNLLWHLRSPSSLSFFVSRQSKFRLPAHWMSHWFAISPGLKPGVWGFFDSSFSGAFVVFPCLSFFRWLRIFQNQRHTGCLCQRYSIKRIGSDVTNTCLLKAMRQSSRNSRTICGEGGVPTKVGMSCNGKSNRLFSLYCVGFVEWRMSRNTQCLPLNYPNSSYSSSVYLNKSSQWLAGSWSFIFSRCLLQGPRVRCPQVLNRPSSCTFQVKSAWIKQQTQWRTLTRSNQYDK